MLSNNPADIPILIAVSILSPVRTHTLMPTDFMNWIVSATLSWSLSSIAVEPMSSRFTSIFSSTAATASSLSFSASFAFLLSSAHFLYSLSSKYLSARYRVLRPSAAYLSTIP